jgi:hypothetical protein
MNPFHPVIDLPKQYVVCDNTNGRDSRRGPGDWAVGRYNEKRIGIYNTPLFGGVRNIHMGIDIYGPVATPIRAFDDGEIFLFGYNAAAGDYGAGCRDRHLLISFEFLERHRENASLA